MEQITSDIMNRQPLATYNISAVSPVRPVQITQTGTTDSGKDSQGNPSQGRGRDEAEAYRPMTFQAVLLSSTTLSSLQDVLSRLSGGGSFAVVDRASPAYRDAVSKLGDGTSEAAASSEDAGTEEQGASAAAETASSTPSSDSQGVGYYGYDWIGSGQLLQAARQATAAYMQSMTAVQTGDTPYAQKAEVLNLVA
ncbi:hypothetical protein [Insolitispirillum peregrinum]|uniref:hypothetical protein n=1 Tax=Insolitispirillum peregrinum TaxID=80876 RepID=UPI003616FB8D